MSCQVVHDKDTSTLWRAWTDTLQNILNELNEPWDCCAATLPNVHPPASSLLTCLDVISRDRH